MSRKATPSLLQAAGIFVSEGVLRRAEASLDAVRTTASARECASASTEFLKFVRRLVDAESANAVGVVQKWGVTQARNAPTCLCRHVAERAYAPGRPEADVCVDIGGELFVGDVA